MPSNAIPILAISGNPDILEEINSNVDFSYVRILKMMYARDDDVRLLAGSALAAFAYNNINQQKEIAEQGGVRFNCFVPFLQSSDEHFRCNAAFQVSRKTNNPFQSRVLFAMFLCSQPNPLLDVELVMQYC